MQVTETDIRALLWDAGLDADDALRTDYSGRGMYGKTCLGVVGSISDIVELGMTLAEQVVLAEEDEREHALQNFRDAFPKFSEDSMLEPAFTPASAPT